MQLLLNMDTRKLIGLTGGEIVRETVAKYGTHHVCTEIATP